ncbi:hypothetical protein JCM11251_006424 [Rhodosporidiobolus azoricus]
MRTTRHFSRLLSVPAAKFGGIRKERSQGQLRGSPAYDMASNAPPGYSAAATAAPAVQSEVDAVLEAFSHGFGQNLSRFHIRFTPVGIQNLLTWTREVNLPGQHITVVHNILARTFYAICACFDVEWRKSRATPYASNEVTFHLREPPPSSYRPPNIDTGIDGGLSALDRRALYEASLPTTSSLYIDRFMQGEHSSDSSQGVWWQWSGVHSAVDRHRRGDTANDHYGAELTRSHKPVQVAYPSSWRTPSIPIIFKRPALHPQARTATAGSSSNPPNVFAR